LVRISGRISCLRDERTRALGSQRVYLIHGSTRRSGGTHHVLQSRKWLYRIASAPGLCPGPPCKIFSTTEP
jgi:hypothetical protein